MSTSSATGTSAQPMPLSPINTQRPRADSNGMGSPSSMMSGYSTDREFPLPENFGHISEEAPSVAASATPLIRSQTQNAGRLHPVQTNASRRSTESVDSQARSLKFNEFSRGRHSTAWLFNNFSFREAIGKIVKPKH